MAQRSLVAAALLVVLQHGGRLRCMPSRKSLAQLQRILALIVPYFRHALKPNLALEVSRAASEDLLWASMACQTPAHAPGQ
jgi:hypothetical protein